MVLLGEFDKREAVGYNVGIQTEEVGAEMAKERDYVKEWEYEKKEVSN